MKLLTLILTFSSLAMAAKVDITRWYRLDSSGQNSSAEVCFKLTPKPIRPQYVRIFVDKRTRYEANYVTWVDDRGSACTVVSSFVGRVEVWIPELSIREELNRMDQEIVGEKRI